MTECAKHYFLAEPHGMCGGVRRALEIVEAHCDNKRFILNEIVHNNFIVDSLKQRGVVTVHSLKEVPEGATVVFSAHGVSRAVEAEAAERRLAVLDATCPLVKTLHRALAGSVAAGEFTILLGHAGHPEVEGTLGQVKPGQVELIQSAEEVGALPDLPPERPVRLLTQTTLDTALVDAVRAALEKRYGAALRADSGVCYATRDRQSAVRALAGKVELLIVIGSARSSNSNRLREVAEDAGCRALLIDRAQELNPGELDGVNAVGVTAGASAPEELLLELTRLLEQYGFCRG